jgi:hypothetical protein
VLDAKGSANMLSTLGAAALHDGQLLPKKNSTTTLLLKLERLTLAPSNDLSVKAGAVEPISSGSITSSSSVVHDENTSEKMSMVTIDFDAIESDQKLCVLFCFIHLIV